MERLFIQQIRAHSRPLDPVPTGREPRLRDLSGVRAVVFDVYGTCFISGSGDIGAAVASPPADALRDSLREQGIDVTPERAREGMDLFTELVRADHARTRSAGVEFPEIRILDIWEEWRREAGVRADVPRLAIDVECRLNPVWPMPGLETCLEQLRDTGRVLGIVSNAHVFTPCLFPALTERSLADYGFAPARRVWSWRRKEAKPSARLYEALLSNLEGIDPSDCLYVGNDMRNDITPAARTGMKTALFAGDRRSLRLREGDPFVQGVNPDLELTRLTQLLECV